MGIHAIAVPTYIGEVATPDVRGMLGAAFQLFVTVGLTIAYLAGRERDFCSVLGYYQKYKK